MKQNIDSTPSGLTKKGGIVMINRQLKETDRKKSCAASFFCIEALSKRKEAGLSLNSAFLEGLMWSI
jgi:hypothetical protein